MTRLARRLPVLALIPLGCAGSALHAPGTPDGDAYVQAPDGSPHGLDVDEAHLRPEVCKGVSLAQEHRTLAAEDFVRFLQAQGLETQVTRARADLAYVDVPNAGTAAPVRFRVAVLDSPGAAGRDLHEALLQHGQGRWGVHRANLAVLAPAGSLNDIVAFAARTKLACWGVLTIADLDDTYVIAGGYAEL